MRKVQYWRFTVKLLTASPLKLTRYGKSKNSIEK